jgi:hypothetical protein
MPMNRSLLALLALAAAVPAFAQNEPQPLPPPIEEAMPATPPDPALPEKIELPPSPDSAPTVQIRKVDNGDTVEEYRVNGRLTMVKVNPLRGASYTLIDANGDGRLDRKDVDGDVAPVYWTLYEWD